MKKIIRNIQLTQKKYLINPKEDMNIGKREQGAGRASKKQTARWI